MSFHRMQICGNLGQTPELRFTPDGSAVTTLSVAVGEKFTTKAGEDVEQTYWYRATAWGRLAEVCAEYLGKGDKVVVFGRPSGSKNEQGNVEPRVWTDKAGNHRASFEMTASYVEFPGRNGGGGSGPAADEAPEEPGSDIPF